MKKRRLRENGNGSSGDRLFVTGLARGLAILAAYQPGRVRMSNAELARSTGLPKATVSRLTHTLRELGYLFVCPETGRYQLHPRVLTLGYPVMASIDVRQVVSPLMQQLADYSGGTVGLGLRDGLAMIFIERSRDRTVRALPLDIGSRVPIATTAMGRAYLAGASEEERRELLGQIRAAAGGLGEALGPELDAAIADASERGYSKGAGTWEPDVNAVGAPVRLKNGQLLAFNCGGPSHRIRPEMLDDLGARLAELARHVETAEWSGTLAPRPFRDASSGTAVPNG